MLSIDEIRKRKEEYRMTNRQLADVSGVPLGTLQKILGNATKSPRLETVKALSAVFEGKNTEIRYDRMEPKAQCVKEPEAAYAVPLNRSFPFESFNTHVYDRQGTYTIDDYLALPEEQRVELIDGVIYDMSAPTAYHQLIGGEIHAEIRNYIRGKNGTCVPFMAPTDVQLDRDNRTMVQPDVMIVCDRNKINHKRVFGAPDFVAEVLSPSTRGKDLLIKSNKYRDAGVQEYWLIDPDNKSVMVYDFRDANNPKVAMFSFEDEIPILLYDGELTINMKEIVEYLSFAE